MAEKEVTETDESDEESSESDYVEVPDLYQEKKWIAGCNFKARSASFEKAATNLRSVLRKNAKEKQVEDIKLKVLEVKRHGD